MAEYCNSCWNEINGERLFEGDLKFTKNEEICKRCGKKDYLVIRRYHSAEKIFLHPYLKIDFHISNIIFELKYKKYFIEDEKSMAGRFCSTCWFKKRLVRKGNRLHLKYGDEVKKCERCGTEDFMIIKKHNIFVIIFKETIGKIITEIQYRYSKWWLKNFDRKYGSKNEQSRSR